VLKRSKKFQAAVLKNLVGDEAVEILETLQFEQEEDRDDPDVLCPFSKLIRKLNVYINANKFPLDNFHLLYNTHKILFIRVRCHKNLENSYCTYLKFRNI
jgi:hypothetical protein